MEMINCLSNPLTNWLRHSPAGRRMSPFKTSPAGGWQRNSRSAVTPSRGKSHSLPGNNGETSNSFRSQIVSAVFLSVAVVLFHGRNLKLLSSSAIKQKREVTADRCKTLYSGRVLDSNHSRHSFDLHPSVLRGCRCKEHLELNCCSHGWARSREDEGACDANVSSYAFSL
jgi:hypothetical protein